MIYPFKNRFFILTLVSLMLAGRLSAQNIDLAPEFEKRGFTPRVQGKRNTCSLFAITELAEFEAATNLAPHTRLSPEFLIWAGNQASGLHDDQAMFYKAVHGLNTLGICSDELMPYTKDDATTKTPSDAATDFAKDLSGRWQVHWLRRWNVKQPVSDEQFQAIKDALTKGHPVACGLRWPQSLRNHELLEPPPVDQVFDGHSIALVGFQDDPSASGGGTFKFLNSYGRRWGTNGYGTMAYAYLRAYANDALWLRFGPPKSEVPLVRFEAESLTIKNSSTCDASPQRMDGPGGLMWSGSRQLFCRASNGGFIDLTFNVASAGEYRVRLLATAAPDYGVIETTLDGTTVGSSFDLYSGKVCPSGSLELGTLKLTSGQHILQVKAIGKNSASANFHFGLDAIDLLPKP